MSEMRSSYPHDWTSKSLEQLCSEVTSGGTPMSGSRRYYVEFGGLPFAKTEDLTRARTKFIDGCELAISDAALKESAAKRYPAGTIFVSMYGTIGLTKIAAVEMAGNQALCALVPPFACNSDYLHHHLEYIRPHWLKHSGQTTQANINGATVRAHEVPLPSFSEQRAIAQILDTLDIAIHEAEAIIAKLKAVKQGLLHDLLTRGIDANGELRPPQSEAPHLYKPSPLGWVPTEWQVAPLSSRIASLDAGVSVNSEDRPHGAGEIGVLKTSALSQGKFLPDQNKAVVASEVTFVREPVLGNSILVSRMNTPELVGESCYVSMPWPTLFLPDRIWQLKKRSPDSVDMQWLSCVFLTPYYRAYVQMHATGTSGSMKNLPKSRLLAMPVAFPGTAEQSAIAALVDAADSRIATEASALEKLRAQKSGLMDDLLTGRVRVTPLLQGAQHA